MERKSNEKKPLTSCSFFLNRNHTVPQIDETLKGMKEKSTFPVFIIPKEGGNYSGRLNLNRRASSHE